MQEFVPHIVHILRHFAFHVRQRGGEVAVLQHGDGPGAVAHVTVPDHLSHAAVEVAVPVPVQPDVVGLARVAEDDTVDGVQRGERLGRCAERLDGQVGFEGGDLGFARPS